MWLPTQPWPLVGLHATVMPDGRVLSYGTPQGIGVQDGRTLDIWSPQLGFSPASHLTIANGQAVDSFCSATATIAASGRILISGGGSANDGYPSLSSTLVDPTRATAANAQAPLAQQRWYGSMIGLADGRVLAGGGGTPYAVVSAYADPAGTASRVSSTPEVFSGGSGWTALPAAASLDAFGAANNRAWYPRMWVAPDATVFGISTDKMWNLDPLRGSIRTVGDFKTTVDAGARPNVGPTSTAVLYDVGKILQLGGNGYNNGYPSPSSPYATIVEIAVPQHPVLTETAAMTYPRQWANALVLPDGRVLVTGGSTYADAAGANAVLPAELWTPQDGRWSLGAAAANYRGYHSATVLLPDGAVLSTGGGVPGPVDNFNAEIYYPPYLFVRGGTGSVLAARPRVVSFSAAAAEYGGTVRLQMADAAPLRGASLIGLSATTHSFNSFQRRVPLVVSQSGAEVALRLPGRSGIAPPGYYLLTVLNGAGVPSRGIIVGLHAAAVPQTDVTAILPADGAVRSLQPVGQPGSAVRHAAFAAVVAPVSPLGDGSARDAASFHIRPGNADPHCVSFESKNLAGFFLRQQDSRLVLQRQDGSDEFARDSTFCAEAGLAGSGFSLRSSSHPERVVHVREGSQVWLDADDGTSAFAAAASFSFSEQYLPVDLRVHGVSQLGAPFLMVRHTDFLGYVSPINAASLAGDRADASFFVRAGRGQPGCYSFEGGSFPGYFLRRTGAQMRLDPADGSAAFDRDSTFCLRSGLAGSGFSLSALDDPTRFVNTHADGGLYVEPGDGSAGFAAAATYALSRAP